MTTMTTYNDENITIDELIKYLEEKRDAFNKLLIAMQNDTMNNVKKGQKDKEMKRPKDKGK